MAKQWHNDELNMEVIDENSLVECLFMIEILTMDFEKEAGVEADAKTLRRYLDDAYEYVQKAKAHLHNGKIFPGKDEPILISAAKPEDILAIGEKIQENIRQAINEG